MQVIPVLTILCLTAGPIEFGDVPRFTNYFSVFHPSVPNESISIELFA